MPENRQALLLSVYRAAQAMDRLLEELEIRIEDLVNAFADLYESTEAEG